MDGLNTKLKENYLKSNVTSVCVTNMFYSNWYNTFEGSCLIMWPIKNGKWLNVDCDSLDVSQYVCSKRSKR
jgi:hypothetical protein